MSDHPHDGVPPVDADATKPQPESHRPTRTIGPYRLLQLVGEGGMGEVWLAEQTHPVRRHVALKVWTNVTGEPVLARGPGAYDRYAVAMDQIIKYQGRYYAYYHASALKDWAE
jgi:serine/threonine protein kinase